MPAAVSLRCSSSRVDMVARGGVAALGETAAGQKEAAGMGPFLGFTFHQRRIAARTVVHLFILVFRRIDRKSTRLNSSH